MLTKGGLAIALSLLLRDKGMKRPFCTIAMSPWLDLTHSLPSWRLNVNDYLPPTSRDPSYISKIRSQYYTTNDGLNHSPYVSPVFASEKNGTLGPILVQVGSEERLRDESLKFAANFKQSDIRLEMYKGNMMCNVLGQVHCFQGFNGQASTLALKNIKQFIDNPQTF